MLGVLIGLFWPGILLSVLKGLASRLYLPAHRQDLLPRWFEQRHPGS